MTRNGQFCMAKMKYTLIQGNFYERLLFYMDSCALSPMASLLPKLSACGSGAYTITFRKPSTFTMYPPQDWKFFPKVDFSKGRFDLGNEPPPKGLTIYFGSYIFLKVDLTLAMYPPPRSAKSKHKYYIFLSILVMGDLPHFLPSFLHF